MMVGYAYFADLAPKLVAIATYVERSEKKSDHCTHISTRPKHLVQIDRVHCWGKRYPCRWP